MNKKVGFTLEDTNKMDWQEFGNIVDKLAADINNYCDVNNITFDAVAPILRNGAIPGTIIANKLEIVTLLPVQVKYDYSIKKPIQIFPFEKPLDKDLGDTPKILVVESNTFTGQSAKLSTDIIKKAYPQAELYYATVTRVYRLNEVKLSMYKEYFYGVMTNENFEADEQKEKELQLRSKITVYPWETAEEELKEINSYFDI